MPSLNRVLTLDFMVDVAELEIAVQDVVEASNENQPMSIAFANVHMAILSNRDRDFRSRLLTFDRVFTDGAPLVWYAKTARVGKISRVAGPDFMMRLCEAGLAKGRRHFFLGGPVGVAQQAGERLAKRYPGLKVVGAVTPPFRPMTERENIALCNEINAAAPDYVWVGLGCPKQELWISENRHRVHARAILGVGQALNIAAGEQKRAPAALRNAGLEWAYRLAREPRRLAGRYLSTNTEFLARSLWHLLSGKRLAFLVPPIQK